MSERGPRGRILAASSQVRQSLPLKFQAHVYHKQVSEASEGWYRYYSQVIPTELRRVEVVSRPGGDKLDDHTDFGRLLPNLGLVQSIASWLPALAD